MLLSRALNTDSCVVALPVVVGKEGEKPMAVLSLPAVLEKSALAPVAVFWWPMVLATRASKPIVLKPPVVLPQSSAPDPDCAFELPLASPSRALGTGLCPAKSLAVAISAEGAGPIVVGQQPGGSLH